MGLSKLLRGRFKRSKDPTPGARNEDDRESSAEPPARDTPPAPVPDVTTSPVPDSDDPWTRAFGKFKQREPELMADYTAHLASLQPDDDATDCEDLASPRSVESIVKQLLDNRAKKQWKFEILGNDIVIRDQAEKLSKFIGWADKIVKDALSAQPYAALAWSGVSMLLPLLTSGTAQNAAMLKGFNRVADVQVYWDMCAKTYLKPPYQQWYRDLVEPMAELYSHVIEYQARIICHLSKAQLRRAWQDVAGWNEWDGKAAHIEDLSSRCSKRIPHLNEEEVRERWSSLQQEVLTIHHAMKEHHQDKKETHLLQDLAMAARSYESDKERVPERVPKTCEWFLTDDRFCKWRDGKQSGLLWVSAGPGCGKSVLSRTLIDEGLLTTSTVVIEQSTGTSPVATSTSLTSTVCYFFFKDGGDGPMDGAQALCAILHQLFAHDLTGKLIAKALPAHKNYGEALTRNFSELWRILLECARSSDRDIVCVLDALDECSEKSRREEVTTTLKKYCSSPTSRIKFLVTSRPYEDIERSFRKFPTAAEYLRFDGNEKAEQIAREIDLVIDVKVEVIAEGFTDEHRLKISERLKREGHRTYLWLHLTLDIIEKRTADYSRFCDIEELLSDLPSGVSDAYEKILSRSKNEHRTRTLLRIVLAAERPLTLEEANITLTSALEKTQFKSHSDLDSHLWPEDNFKDTVTGICGLFITVYDSKLFFIHQTAREFLVHPSQGKWQGRFDMPSSHATMSSVCLNYLLLPTVGSSLGKWPFLGYAAEYWPSHYVSQDASAADQSRKDARALCNFSEDRVRPWAAKAPKGKVLLKLRTDLILASFLGLTRVVNEILLETSRDIDGPSGHAEYSTALQAASARGHTEIVRTLLDRGADINKEAGRYGTALQAASANRRAEIVRTLLERGAEVNKEAGLYGTALQVVLAYGRLDSYFPGTPLQAASANSATEIVTILLDRGADVEQEAGYYGTALQAASASNYMDIVITLLDRGADVNKEAGYYGTALQAASAYGHAEIVRTLLDRGAEVNKEAGRFGTALQAASAGRRIETVRTLLDRGADVNKEAGLYGAPLQIAAANGYTDLVEILLDTGARDIPTALQSALANGHADVVELLHAKGAISNADLKSEMLMSNQVAEWEGEGVHG